MKISAQEEYGLRCLLCLARITPEESLTIPEIGKLEGLSQSHVAKILSLLRKGGFVTATRGQLGGYRLTQPPENISVQAAMQSLGGRLFDACFCRRHSGLEGVCTHETDCAMRPLWLAVQAAVDEVTRRLTLADLLHGRVPEPLLHLSPTPERPPLPAS